MIRSQGKGNESNAQINTLNTINTFRTNVCISSFVGTYVPFAL